MQTVVLVIALWLILLGLYGAISLLLAEPATRRAPATRRSMPRPRNTRPPVIHHDAPTAILSEVDLLRAQVHHLRSEILVSGSPELDKAKPRKYRSASADLPRPLRRQLREARGVRTA